VRATLLAACTALLVSAALQPLAIRWLRRRGAMDVPSPRSSHTVAVPRGGGVAVLIGILAGSLWGVSSHTFIPVLAAAAASAAVGLAEDLRGIPARARLLLLTVAAAPVAALHGGDHRGLASEVVLGVGLVVFTVSVTNAFNFMDGINGISAATGFAAGIAFAALAIDHHEAALAAISAAVAGSCVGFAPYNTPTARVFLGDCGAYGIGAALAGISAALWLGGVTIEAAIAPLAIYLADTGATLARRVWLREPWDEPHRMHTYQRLADRGWSHPRVAALIFGLVAVCSLLGAMAGNRAAPRLICDLALATVVAAYLSLPTLLDQSQVMVSVAHARVDKASTPR